MLAPEPGHAWPLGASPVPAGPTHGQRPGRGVARRGAKRRTRPGLSQGRDAASVCCSPLRPVLAAALATTASAARITVTTRMAAHQTRSGRPVSRLGGPSAPAAERRRRRCLRWQSSCCFVSAYLHGCLYDLHKCPHTCGGPKEDAQEVCCSPSCPQTIGGCSCACCVPESRSPASRGVGSSARGVACVRAKAGPRTR